MEPFTKYDRISSTWFGTSLRENAYRNGVLIVTVPYYLHHTFSSGFIILKRTAWWFWNMLKVAFPAWTARIQSWSHLRCRTWKRYFHKCSNGESIRFEMENQVGGPSAPCVWGVFVYFRFDCSSSRIQHNFNVVLFSQYNEWMGGTCNLNT